MAINFTDLGLNGLTSEPRLPEGTYVGRLTNVETRPAVAETATAKAKPNVLILTYKINFKEIDFVKSVYVYNYTETMTVKSTGAQFQPIANIIDPLRAQFDLLNAKLVALLKLSEKKDTRLEFFRNKNGYLELRIAYPEPKTEEPALELIIPAEL